MYHFVTSVTPLQDQFRVQEVKFFVSFCPMFVCSCPVAAPAAKPFRAANLISHWLRVTDKARDNAGRGVLWSQMPRRYTPVKL